MSLRILAIGLICAAGLAHAHSGATGIVKERMDGMLVLGEALKVLSQESKKDSPNTDIIRTAAQNLQSHSGAAMTEKFPEGSLDHPTEASPNIWVDFEGFSKSADALFDHSKALENRPADLAELFPKIAQTCKSCHQEYRIKK